MDAPDDGPATAVAVVDSEAPTAPAVAAATDPVTTHVTTAATTAVVASA
jgi:hypothetical protein